MSGAPALGPLLVVTGPTASGKTALAIALAQSLEGELIGADSVQVYRGLDIGSNKPTAAELGDIPHHLLDVREPDQPLDAVDFAAMADAAIADVRARGRVPIVVGGAGMWLRALLRGLLVAPPREPAIAERLAAEAVRIGVTALHARLAQVDALAASAIHAHDLVRIIRALEYYEQTGQPLGAARRQHALGQPRYDALRIVLDPGPEALTERIVQRTRAMIEAGLAAETRRLAERFGRELRVLASVGYREMMAHLYEGATLEQTETAIIRSTRIYARRQRTWLRSEPGERWDAHSDQILSSEGLTRLRHWLADATDRRTP